VAHLSPFIEAEKATIPNQGKILMAHVKAMCTISAKNIVGVAGSVRYDVVDNGLMVPADKILETP